MYARIEVAEDRDAIGDAELLRYFRRGDQSALDLLMERHRDALFRFCYHLTGNREDAEDVCQETLARAMTRVGSLQSDSAFRSWLFSIARNLSVDTHRRKKRTVAMPDDEAMPIQLFTETPQDRVEVAEEHQTVVEAMGKLAQSHQRVLVLREVEGMSYAAIAEELDVSQSAVETLLFRARRRLKEEYHKSAAPALALLAGIRELVLRAAGPAAGGAAVKLAVTAAMVSSMVLTVPHTFRFPQVPASSFARPKHQLIAAPPHRSTVSHPQSSAASPRVAVLTPPMFRPIPASPSRPVTRSVVSVPRHASSTPRKTSRRALSSRHHAFTRKAEARAKRLKKSIPPLPSKSNTHSGTSRIPPPPPPPSRNAPAPSVAAAPSNTDTNQRWVPAAVQQNSAGTAPPPPPVAQPTPAPAPTQAPPVRSVPRRNAPVQPPPPPPGGSAPARTRKSGQTAPPPPVVVQAPPPTAVPQYSPPQRPSRSAPTSSGTTYAGPAPVPTSAPVQSGYGSGAGATTAPGRNAAGNQDSSRVPPGQAKKDNPPGADNKPGKGPH